MKKLKNLRQRVIDQSWFFIDICFLSVDNNVESNLRKLNYDFAIWWPHL